MTPLDPNAHGKHYLYIEGGFEFPVSRLTWLDFAKTQTGMSGLDTLDLREIVSFVSNKYGVTIRGRIDAPSMDPIPPQRPENGPEPIVMVVYAKPPAPASIPRVSHVVRLMDGQREAIAEEVLTQIKMERKKVRGWLKLKK